MWRRDIFYPIKEWEKDSILWCPKIFAHVPPLSEASEWIYKKRKSPRAIEQWACISIGETSHYKFWKTKAKYNRKEWIEEAVNIFWSLMLESFIFETLSWCHAHSQEVAQKIISFYIYNIIVIAFLIINEISISVYPQIPFRTFYYSLRPRETFICLGWIAYWPWHWRVMGTLVMLEQADKGLHWLATSIIVNAVKVIRTKRLEERWKPHLRQDGRPVKQYLRKDGRPEKLRWKRKCWKNSGGSSYKPVRRYPLSRVL